MAVFDCSNTSLKKGSNNTEKVKTLQTQLKTLGYYNGKIDGSFGPLTDSAVRAFQRAYNLKVDGYFGSESCKKLNQVVESKTQANTTTTVTGFDCTKISLKRGSKDKANVEKLQTMLKAAGYYNRQVDGDFGKYTEDAVKALQQATGHDPDGWFGPKTCPDLNKAYTGKTSSGSSVTSSKPKDTTPEHRRKVTAKLTVLPTVVVLPETEINSTTMTKTVTQGAINTDTNFDCSKISLSVGSKGDDVTKLQTILKARGYYTRQIDGEFGNYTKKAVKKLQSAQGNSPDGHFGPKTCSKLQGTSTTSNKATGTEDKKNTNFVITDFKSFSMNDDIEGLSHEVSITTPYSQDKMNRLRKLQKTQFDVYYGTDVLYQHEGYINEFKISQADDGLMIDLSLVGYTAFLDLQVEFEKTAKRSELIKELAKLAGLKAEVDLTGLTDDEYTVKAQKGEAKSTTDDSGGSGLVDMSNNDCIDNNTYSRMVFDVDKTGGNYKIGNSSANYAQDTKNMTIKEVIQDCFARQSYHNHYNHWYCPQKIWKKTGKIYANCADHSRLIKALCDVHGVKCGIYHWHRGKYGHYFNLIEINGHMYRFDMCFAYDGKTSPTYGSYVCNNLTKNGGPWQV